MAPGSAAAHPTLTFLRPRRVHRRRGLIVRGGVPIETPLVNDGGDVEEAESIRRAAADGPWAVERPGWDLALGKRVSPGRRRAFAAAAGGALPFGFGGQPEAQ